MYMREENAGEKLQVQSYGDGGFRVADKRIEGAMVITANYADSLNLSSLDDLNNEHLEEMSKQIFSIGEGIEIILFGGGASMKQLPTPCAQWLRDNKFAFDVMDTGGAARTYNILQSENRRVAAVMMPV